MPDCMPSGELEDVMNLQDSTASMRIKRITNAQTRTERQQPVITSLIVLRHSLPRY